MAQPYPPTPPFQWCNMSSYLRRFSTIKTPQSEPIPGSGQEPNNADGYAWAVDDWARLDRFLILGSEGGTYYVNERALTLENAEAVLRCIAADGPRAVRRIVEISVSGRAPKNDPAIFALAMASVSGNEATRQAAYQALPRVCRIGTHLFHFAAFREQVGGWSAGLRRAVRRWYEEQPVAGAAYQIIKYRQRDGWSHRDLLRLAHPKADDATRNALYHYAVKGWESVGEEPHSDAELRQVWAAERLRNATPQRATALIREYRLPREVVPTELLQHAAVWEALAEDMPLTALIRNLATLTGVGVVTPGSEIARRVAAQLGDGDRLRRARIHPVAILAALLTYQAGHGARDRSTTWQPVPQIVDALDAAFYASFGNIEPTGKRLLLGLDMSGSMTWGTIAGVPGLSPRVGTAALALIAAATEPDCRIMAFSHELVPFNVSPRQRLDDVVKAMDALAFGGTDCALPMEWARQNKIDVDCFAVYTDSETWFGKIHPAQALRQYRKERGIPSRLVVVGMVSNGFSIADPNDAGMLDVVGFDTATPQIISDFARGQMDQALLTA